MKDSFFSKAFSEDGSRRAYLLISTLVFFALSFFCFFWFFISGAAPEGYSQYLHILSGIGRMYLAGAAFIALCFGTGQRNRYGILAGAVGYSFCGFTLLGVIYDPGRIDPMIWFPLVILGMEKVIRRERKYLLVAAAAVMAAVSPALSMTGMILSLVYALIRLGLLCRKEPREGIAAFAKILLSLAVGVCMAGIWLLPALLMSAPEHRISFFRSIMRLYPRTYYSALPGALISNSSSGYTLNLIMAYTPLVIPAVFLLFLKKKKDIFLKVLAGVCLAAVLLPAVSVMLNGTAEGMPVFCSWGAALFGMYVLVREWDDLVNVTDRQKRLLFGLCAAYFGVCLLCLFSRTTGAMAAFPLLFLALLTAGEGTVDQPVWRDRILLGIIAFGAASSAFWIYAPDAGGLALSAEIWDESADEQAALTEGEINGIEAAGLGMADFTAEYGIECQGTEISQGPNCFITTSEGTKAVLTLQQGLSDAETYIGFTGLEVTPTPGYDLYLGSLSVDPLNLYNRTNWDMLSKDEQISLRREKTYPKAAWNVNISIETSSGNKKELEYVHSYGSPAGEGRDFFVSLGQAPEAVTAVTLTFPEAGVYSYEELKVYQVPMNGREEGIVVPAEEHKAERPGRGAGAMLSLIALAGFVFLVAVDERKMRDSKR